MKTGGAGGVAKDFRELLKRSPSNATSTSGLALSGEGGELLKIVMYQCHAMVVRVQ